MVNLRVTKIATCVCWEGQGGLKGRDSSPTQGLSKHDRTCVWPYCLLQAPPQHIMSFRLTLRRVRLWGDA